MPENKLLSTKQLMDYLGIGRNKAYSLMTRDDFPSFMLDGLWKVSQKALDEWIDRQSK